jgi:hypothetical protein
MSWSSRKPSEWFAAVALLGAFAGCTGEAAFECGPGSEERFGRCVVTAAPDVRCGEGTVLDEDANACVPLITCGEGSFPDPDTGFCDPEAECGPGTFLDLQTGACVTESECGPGTEADLESGLCLEVLVCGPGTLEQDGTCTPLPPCTEGALLDPVTGECTADQSCGAGLVIVDGVCVEEDRAIALEADVVESLPDRNDPASGGVPEDLVLEPRNERAVALGKIDRPATPEGAADPVQDIDVWRFTGSRGLYLRAQVVSLGLPQPAFTVRGPNGYYRESPLGYERNPMRELVLPYDGEYEIAVVPSAFLLSGQAIGGSDAEYALVVEERQLPGRQSLDVGLGVASAGEATGETIGLDDNFFALQAPSGVPVIVEIDGDFANNTPALLAFNQDNQLLAHVQDAGDAGWMGLLIREDAYVVVDWTRSVAAEGEFTIRPYIPPTVIRGDIPADYNTVTGRHPLLVGQTGGAFTFRFGERQVASCDIFGSGVFRPDVQVVGPGGTVAKVDDDDEVFFLAEPGDYTLFVFNDSTSDDSDVGLTIRATTPYALGDLGDGESGPVAAGEPLGFGFAGWEDAWSVVTSPAGTTVSLDVAAEVADPVLEVYDLRGQLLRRLRRPHLAGPVPVLNRDGGALLVRLESNGRAAEGWRLGASVDTPVELDLEPNDSRATAVLVGAAPVRLTGVAHDDEADVYRIQLPALADGEALEVRFDNLESDSSFSSISDSSEVRVYDAEFQELPVLPSDGVLGVHSLTVVPGFALGDEIYVEIVGTHIPSSQPQGYLLDVRVADRLVEVEPNDANDSADVLALGGTIAGYLGGGDAADIIRLDLEADLGARESLLVEARNVETNNALKLTVRDATGNIVAASDRVLAAAAAPALPAGAYFIEVRGSATTLLYELSARVGAQAEIEPNDLVAEDLGALDAAGITWEGLAGTGDVDRLTFTLPAALAPETALRARLINLDDSTAHAVRLVDGHGATDFVRALDDAATAELRAALPGAGTFGIVVEGTGTKADRYRVELTLEAAAELEPNESAAAASELPSVPGSFFATVAGGDVDFMAFDLDAGVSEAIVTMENVSDGSTVEMSLTRSTGASLGGGAGFRVRQPIVNPTAGRYIIRLIGQQAATDASDIVRIDVEVR